MTTWAVWTCPICGNKWRGSVGWWLDINGPGSFSRDDDRKEAFNLLLETLCGCTKKALTEDQLKSMGGACTRGPDVEDDGQ